ncbi:proline iminopeptidase-family hydrolase [Pontibacter chitinilyticus]|uniref:proline iminopeptidase-family hydrolase n=1 Tax=Pontibacter chitinilyticus TaxID=2674989 RepID=UPI0032193A5B
MKKHFSLLAALLGALALSTSGCQRMDDTATAEAPTADYLNFKTPGDVQAGGVQMVQLKEGYKVWTKRFGNSPTMKVLLLHGGPAMTHEYMEAFESFFPQANIEFYEYDQLGSAYSDQPDDMSLYNIDRFVEEVEQVRQQLGMNKDNFYLLGNSWGGMLAMEYALKHQDQLKGLIICNMTASFPKYAVYNAKLRAEMRPSLIDSLEVYEQKNDFMNPVYQQLVFDNYYRKHLCRLPVWPEAVMRSLGHVNQKVYEYMQGPSEFVPGGILQKWDRWNDLKQITVPTLTVGAKYDTMNPEEMKEMSQLVQNGQYLYCPNGSHLAMWDDQQVYMNGVIKFIKDVNTGKVKKVKSAS